MEKIKVIMIDDNVNLISMVEDYFEDNQKIEIVGKAYDGIEGLKLIKNKDIKYDLVILDLIMPKKDGIGVLKDLSKEDIHPNVIVATSYNAPDTIRKVSEFGVTYYILKPFDLLDLEDKILDTFSTSEKKTINLFNNNATKLAITIVTLFIITPNPNILFHPNIYYFVNNLFIISY